MEGKFGTIEEGRRLPREFYTRDGITVARELLGKVLVHETDVGRIRGLITEVESYMGVEDKGSHAYGGRRTQRTEPMFHQGGTSYVYLIYGMYSCMNIVSSVPDVPHAVLLRGVEPADPASRERMLLLRRQGKAARGKQAGDSEGEVRASLAFPHLADGPGKLCIAMGIDRRDNDVDLVESPTFYVTEGIYVPPGQIRIGKRVGIDYAEEAADYLWRFYL